MKTEQSEPQKDATGNAQHSLERLVRLLDLWRSEEQRWLEAGNNHYFAEDKREKYLGYSDVYRRCREQLESVLKPNTVITHAANGPENQTQRESALGE